MRDSRRPRDWERIAKALDMKLAGAKYREIAAALGVSNQRAQQMVMSGAHTLAFRLFKGVPRYIWRFDKQRGEWKAEQ